MVNLNKRYLLEALQAQNREDFTGILLHIYTVNFTHKIPKSDNPYKEIKAFSAYFDLNSKNLPV